MLRAVGDSDTGDGAGVGSAGDAVGNGAGVVIDDRRSFTLSATMFATN